MFATDRDLLTLEPWLFGRIGWLAQRTLGPVPASLAAASTVLSLGGGDAEAAGVGAGSVVALASIGAVEVVSRTGPTALVVSRLRASVGDGAIPPTASSWSGDATVWTFAPQIAAVHRSLLHALGIEDGEAPASAPSGTVFVSQVTNAEEWAHTEALGAMAAVLDAAHSAHPADSHLGERARLYRRRYDLTRAALVADIDTDGDGRVDTRRAMSATQLRRG
jgi:hypothetical protein